MRLVLDIVIRPTTPAFQSHVGAELARVFRAMAASVESYATHEELHSALSDQLLIIDADGCNVGAITSWDDSDEF